MAYFEETNPCDIAIESVLRVLTEFFPSIGVDDIIFLYHGTYNVFEVGDDYIFKFPDRSLRNEKGLNLILRERGLQVFLRPFLSLVIPRFEYVSSDPSMPFVGYRKIEGVSLSRCFNMADLDQVLSVARRLGEFLSELHSFRVYEAFRENWPSDFTPETHRRYWHDHYQRLRKEVFPRLSSVQREWVDGLFTGFLEDDGNFRFEPRVVHCDFDTTNIIVDPESFEVRGIIDFEETGVWDPAADFLFFREGLEFMEEILASYSLPLGSNIESRMRFLYDRQPLIYLLTGYEWNYPNMVDAGFGMLRDRMGA
jgi:aminoglycoside 2''-phosphotransferase